MYSRRSSKYSSRSRRCSKLGCPRAWACLASQARQRAQGGEGAARRRPGTMPRSRASPLKGPGELPVIECCHRARLHTSPLRQGAACVRMVSGVVMDLEGSELKPSILRARRSAPCRPGACDVLHAVLVRRVPELMVVAGLLLTVCNCLCVRLCYLFGRLRICWVLRCNVPPGQRGVRHERSPCDRGERLLSP